MINEKCFTRDWIDAFQQKREHKNIQRPILEKMIRALYLLEQLEVLGLNFVFKGGTSLVLLLENNNRFSTDIDIIYQDGRQVLEKVLEKVVENSSFTAMSLDEHRSYKEGVPKAHYMFEFESVYNPMVSGKIFLDILFEDVFYPEIQQTPIQTKWIETSEQIAIATPSINAIAGDKLTAFAPNTIGIPYYKGTESFAMEICKQLYDVSKLFESITELSIVNESFLAFTAKEIEYRNHQTEFKSKDIDAEKVLKDIIETCLLITKREGNKEDPYKSQFKDLERGVRALGSNFLMQGNFRIEDAIVASAKVAHLAAKLLVGDLEPIAFYEGSSIRELSIEDPAWNFLNKLKRQPDKSSFYYWYHTVFLLVK